MTMKLPVVPKAEITGQIGMTMLTAALHPLAITLRPVEILDVGIDCQIEILRKVNERKLEATGRLIGVQVKCGPSFFEHQTDDEWVHYCSVSHANYWQCYSLPVVLVLCDPKPNKCFWVEVNDRSLIWTPEGAKVLVPKANDLGSAKSALEAIAGSRKTVSDPSERKRYIFPLDGEYNVALSHEELGSLCGEASIAIQEDQATVVDVDFEVEPMIAAEADSIRTKASLSPLDRKRLVELASMSETLRTLRRRLNVGIRLLLEEPYLRDGNIVPTDFDEAARAVGGFIQHYMFDRLGRRGAEGLALDAFIGDGSNGLIAKIDLSDEEEAEFRRRHGFANGLEPMRWPGYLVGDLGHEVIIDRALPAITSAIVIFLERKNLMASELFNSLPEPLFGWRIGLH
ncbi:DUF4365 domain-containing protein [Neorhizobium galegae]|nr:DUF4365 domain-containing protein [Neorhizobium galegae]